MIMISSAFLLNKCVMALKTARVARMKTIVMPHAQRWCAPQTNVRAQKIIGIQQQDCGTDEFWCGVVCECMPLWWMCDGEVDCEHDEDTCTHIAPACNQIKEYKCDGVAQCVDGSDEVMCEEGWEKGRDFMRDKETDQPCHGSFQCYNDLSDSCVSYHKICDGVKDCPYGEDENKCSYGDNPCKNNNGGCSHTCTHLPTDAWRRSKKVQKGGFFNRLNIGKTPPPPTHKCLCPEGFELDCDNRTCVDIDECLHSHTCSHTCVNKHGFYVCLCHEGYVLGKDLKSCVVKGDRPRLLFSRDNTIIRSYLRNELAGTNKNNNNNSNNKNNIKNEANPKKHDTNNSNHINQSYSTIKNISDWLSFRHKLTSFDLDLHSKKIIFTDGFDLFIHRIDIGSTLKVPSKDCVDRPNFQQQQSETTTSQSPPLQHPHHTSPPPSPPIINSLVHDWLHGNTYLSNIGSHTIQLVTHALVCVRVLYVRQPNLLAIDPRKRFLFWTSSSEETSLFRSHLDGSGVTAVLSRDQAPRVTAVAIDPTNGQVYITEAVTHTLSTMHEDGGARRVLLSSTTILKMPGSVMVFEDTVYWTDIKRKKIYYTNKYPSKQRRLVNEIETSATRLLVSHPVLFDEEQDIHECTHGYLPVNATSHICIYPQEVQQAKSWWLFVFVFLPLILFLVFVFLFVYSYLRKKKRGRVGVQLPHPSIEPLFATSQSKHI